MNIKKILNEMMTALRGSCRRRSSAIHFSSIVYTLLFILSAYLLVMQASEFYNFSYNILNVDGSHNNSLAKLVSVAVMGFMYVNIIHLGLIYLSVHNIEQNSKSYKILMPNYYGSCCDIILRVLIFLFLLYSVGKFGEINLRSLFSVGGGGLSSQLEKYIVGALPAFTLLFIWSMLALRDINSITDSRGEVVKVKPQESQDLDPHNENHSMTKRSIYFYLLSDCFAALYCLAISIVVFSELEGETKRIALFATTLIVVIYLIVIGIRVFLGIWYICGNFTKSAPR